MNRLNPERWSGLWQRATNRSAPSGLYERLLAMYAEQHRHYHNQQHIADCLSEFDPARHLATEPDAVELAIWFHDAIYDTRASDNEERSAELASSWLRQAGASAALTDSVQRSVLATKAHTGTSHPDASLLVDVDLSIFGQCPQRFWEYERAIRAEYAWVEQETYVAKRAEILARFLARPRIYLTEYFYGRFEESAQVNLHSSIERLRSGITP